MFGVDEKFPRRRAKWRAVIGPRMNQPAGTPTTKLLGIILSRKLLKRSHHVQKAATKSRCGKPVVEIEKRPGDFKHIPGQSVGRPYADTARD